MYCANSTQNAQRSSTTLKEVNTMEILIEEIARVALGMVFDEIGHELGVSDEELLQVRDYLEAKLQEDNDGI